MSGVTPAGDRAGLGRVAVLMGGWAAEREISLASGRAVLEALRASGVDAHAVDVVPGFLRGLLDPAYERAFVCLHGRGGEDGVVQGALEALGLAYTGSGVMGSALAMDKYRSKLAWRGAGLPTPEFRVPRAASELAGVADALGLPVMVKPVHEGSSLGMRRADDLESLAAAWEAARALDPEVLVERWVDGPEFTAAVLDGEVLPLIRLETPRAFYDYEAKYADAGTRYIVPCGLPAEREQALMRLALEAFEVLGCTGWGRVDLFLDRAGGPWLIEVNTVPGMTDHSLVPMAAAEAGIDFNQLALRILDTASLDRVDVSEAATGLGR